MKNAHKKIVAVLFFSALLVFLNSGATEAAAHQDSHNRSTSEITEVLITEEGFIPDRIEIDQGATVVWRNQIERPSWPASNFHPTHSLYKTEKSGCISSALDACRGLEKGEEFSFVFDKPGHWGMHDHLYPAFTMRVSVLAENGGTEPDEENAGTSSQVFASFFQKISDFFYDIWDTLKNLFGSSSKEPDGPAPEGFIKKDPQEQLEYIERLAQEDPEYAWSYLKQAFIHEGQVIGNAHQHAHIVGNQAYSLMGFPGVRICDEAFAYGCFHGVTEKMLFAEGPGAINKVEEVCIDEFPPHETFDFTGCIHGAGHGLFSWAAYDIQEALRLCDNFAEQYKNYCYDGVFMEYSFNASLEDHKKDLLGDPWSLCSGLDEKYHHNCARYYVPLMTNLFNFGTEQQAKLCLEAPTENMKSTCYKNLGYMTGQATKGDPVSTRELCGYATEVDGEYGCLIGAVTELVFQNYKDWQKNTRNLCESISNAEWGQECYSAINKTAKMYNRQ